MPIWKWSKTAANNASADPNINWAEGQAPSTVNNSARGVMAEMAKWRDDISGTIVTGGSSTAYTVTTNSGLAGSLEAGFMVAFIPHATNGGATTLNVDSSGALPLRGYTGVALDAGTLVLGTPYVAVLNAAETEWLLIGFRGRDVALPPLGALLPYTGAAAPSSNFLLPYGQAISRSTYAAYFDLVGTTYGAGNGTTTFNVPDLRGRSIFGLDNMGGTSANRIATVLNGDNIGETGGADTVTLDTTMIPSHSHTFTGTPVPDHGHAFRQSAATNSDSATTGGLMTATDGQVNRAAFAGTPSATAGEQIGAGGAHTPAGSNSNTGGGAAHNNMPPAIVLPFILRVL